jgi:small subunit ribosomal protein S16
MLAIRMQRTGRKGHAMFRLVVQESRLTPTSGKVVERIGSYDPHAKSLVVDKEKASFYLDHGAQPSERAARLLKGEGVKLPSWVKQPTEKTGKVRSPEKRRSTNPVKPEEPAPQAEAAPEAVVTEEETQVEAPVEAETPAEAETPNEADTAEPAVETAEPEAEVAEPEEPAETKEEADEETEKA